MVATWYVKEVIILVVYCVGHADAEHDPNRCGRVGVIPGVCRVFHPQYVALISKKRRQVLVKCNTWMNKIDLPVQ